MTTKITTDNILDGTIDAVDMKDLAITNAKLAGSIDVTSKLTGSVPTTNLPTIPVSKGGTGLTSLGSAGQAVKVNSGASALEFGSAGGLVKLFQGSASSAASFQINSTYINSTYDNYLMFIDATPVTDAQQLRMAFLHSDSVHTGSDYFYETEVHSSSTHSYDHDAADHIRVCHQTPGNATGEGINGDYTVVNDSASSQGGSFNGGQDLGGRTTAITGIYIYFASGNIIMNDFAIYGVVK
jgi:hypothetical protein